MDQFARLRTAEANRAISVANTRTGDGRMIESAAVDATREMANRWLANGGRVIQALLVSVRRAASACPCLRILAEDGGRRRDRFRGGDRAGRSSVGVRRHDPRCANASPAHTASLKPRRPRSRCWQRSSRSAHNVVRRRCARPPARSTHDRARANGGSVDQSTVHVQCPGYRSKAPVQHRFVWPK